MKKLFLFSTLLFLSLTFASAICHVDDHSGLLGFKSGIKSDPSGMLSTWKPGTDCCTWAGVNCRVNNRITSLSLTGQLDKPNTTLSGTISPSLSKLKFLDGLYLQNLRKLSGPFPIALFNLPNLLFVYIENSKLSGPIPSNISKLTQLGALSLEGNRFSGPIPNSISKLIQLTQLKLANNLFTGSVPLGIGKLMNLTLLSLERNKLSGSIPDFFGSFVDWRGESHLRIVRLSHNNFTGNIPASISSLTPRFLTYLELGHNALTGKIPEYFGNFKSLDTLDLSHNKLSGTLPKSFVNLTKIFNLDLSYNNLVDPFPELKVLGIESLDLSYNKLNLKQIPNWVTSSPIIYSLKLAGCGIKMKLDDWKPKETYYYDYIDLSGNEISGSAIGLLNKTSDLVGFWASGNKLRFDLGSLKIVKTLKYLDLSKNLLYGKVPKEIAGLQQLNLSYNHLCGVIPATKFAATAFVGNDCLCGTPLSPCK